MGSIIFHNAKIYTPSGYKTWMRISGNKIDAVGDGEPIIQAGEKSIDLNNHLVLPGLHDAHLHVYGVGLQKSQLDLKDTRSIGEIQNKLQAYSKNRTGWIVGRAWDQDYLIEKRMPTRFDIDEVISDRPVFLYRACHHIGVINSKAIELLNLSPDTDPPSGGEIDVIDGKLTGIIKENAIDLVKPCIKSDRETRKKHIELGLQTCLNFGLTSVQTNDGSSWQLYKELQEEGKVPIRVHLAIYHNEMNDPSSPEAGETIGLLRCDRVKLFADGSLGGRTAALRDPYYGTNSKGMLIYTQEELNQLVLQAKENAFRVEIHAIGDLAAQYVIDSCKFAKLTKKDRPILTHAQILGKDLIEEMSKYGIIANIQPSFLFTDSHWVDDRLGDSERINYSYAWKTLIESGVMTSGGSDAPIESPNPLLGMYESIYREDPEGNPWHEDESLSFDQALHLFTHAAAYTSMNEDEVGIIKPGFLADFVVLDRDVHENPRLLKEAKVLQVWVEGIKAI
jgi:hypothetical protein